MNEGLTYNTIEFKGAMLQPSFSIYLFEITHNLKKHFYIGMTGDNFYPSARSAVHRLAGHLDLSARSTQNQLLNAINEKIGFDNLAQATIKMHHFPISGFVPWEGELAGSTRATFNGSEPYVRYKTRQQQVLQLENQLIKKFEKNLLNKTKGNKGEIESEFQGIYDGIENIISQYVNKVQ